MGKKSTKGTLLLLLGSFIWGTTFVAQSAGMDYIGPFTFIAVRSLIAAAALVPAFMLLDRRAAHDKTAKGGRTLWTGGILCGLLLFVASNFQQLGIVDTTAGKAGFITSLYIILVPVFGAFLGRKIRPAVWISVALAIAGLYLLSVKDGFSIGRGDLLVLVCAVFFAMHILVVDHFSPLVDSVRLSCIQFLTCGVLSIPLMFAFEQPSVHAILNAWMPILYAALLSGCVAYTLQIVAQQYVEPSRASLLMCLESVFAALAGWIVLNEMLSVRELLGCLLVFTGVVISVLPQRKTHGVRSEA